MRCAYLAHDQKDDAHEGGVEGVREAEVPAELVEYVAENDEPQLRLEEDLAARSAARATGERAQRTKADQVRSAPFRHTWSSVQRRMKRLLTSVKKYQKYCTR